MAYVGIGRFYRGFARKSSNPVGTHLAARLKTVAATLNIDSIVRPVLHHCTSFGLGITCLLSLLQDAT